MKKTTKINFTTDHGVDLSEQIEQTFTLLENKLSLRRKLQVVKVESHNRHPGEWERYSIITSDLSIKELGAFANPFSCAYVVVRVSYNGMEGKLICTADIRWEHKDGGSNGASVYNTLAGHNWSVTWSGDGLSNS